MREWCLINKIFSTLEPSRCFQSKTHQAHMLRQRNNEAFSFLSINMPALHNNPRLSFRPVLHAGSLRCNSSAARPKQTYKSLKLMLRLFCCIIFTVFSTACDRRKKKWVIVGQHNSTSLGNIASVLLRRLVARCGEHVVNESSNMKLKKGNKNLMWGTAGKFESTVFISTFNISKIWKFMQSFIRHPKTRG